MRRESIKLLGFTPNSLLVGQTGVITSQILCFCLLSPLLLLLELLNFWESQETVYRES